MKASLPSVAADVPVRFSCRRNMGGAMNDALRLAARSPKAYFGFLSVPAAFLSATAAAAMWLWLRSWLSHGFISLLAERNHYPAEIVAALRRVPAAEIAADAAVAAVFVLASAVFLAAVMLQVRAFRQEGSLAPSFFRTCRRLGLRVFSALRRLLVSTPRHFTLLALSTIVLLLPAVIAWMPAIMLGLVWCADAENVLLGEPSALTAGFHAAFALCCACGAALSALFAAWQIWTLALYGKLLPQENTERDRP